MGRLWSEKPCEWVDDSCGYDRGVNYGINIYLGIIDTLNKQEGDE